MYKIESIIAAVMVVKDGIKTFYDNDIIEKFTTKKMLSVIPIEKTAGALLLDAEDK